MLAWVGERGSLLPSSDQAFDIVLLSFSLPSAMVQASSSDSSAKQQDEPLPGTVFDSASCNRRGSVPAPPLSPRSRARTWLTTLCPFEQVR